MTEVEADAFLLDLDMLDGRSIEHAAPRIATAMALYAQGRVSLEGFWGESGAFYVRVQRPLLG